MAKTTRPYKMKNREKNEPVPKRLLSSWKSKIRYGIMTEAAEKCGVNSLTIERVFKSGMATPSLRAKMEKFFAK